MKKRRMHIILAAVCCCICLTGCKSKTEIDFSSAAESERVSETEAQENRTEATETDSEAEETIFVYICGEVRYPDVYELTAGMRIRDAVLAAGGFTEAAAEDYWNLAEVLEDGEMIYIPTQEEAAARRSDRLPGQDASEEADDGRININTASKEQLMTLSGIGESRAERIIAYREKNGDFESTADLVKVSGIGDALYESIMDVIKVE